MPDLLLTTPRLTLHRLSRDDLDVLDALNREPGVMRFLDREPPSRARVAAELDELLADQRVHPGRGRFRADDRAEGAFLGWFGLMPRAGGEFDLGYRLRTAAWGRGLATEGGRALVAHAFRTLAAVQVTAQTMSVNLASRRVMEKCGLRHVRTFHEHFDDPLPGTEHGEVAYALTRQQWCESANAA